MQRNSAIVLPDPASVTTASHTWVVLPAWTFVATVAIRPSRAVPRKLDLSSTVVGLADTACGLATRALLPDGAAGFTTIELKSNFLGTVREGRIATVATNAHAGRTTQVWDAVVSEPASGKTIALFRCTQSVLWPR